MRSFIVLVLVCLVLILAGCSSAPPAAQPGSPAFIWGAAKSTYAAGDFLKASDNLVQLDKSDNEFTARSMPWSIVLTTGIARGYSDLADNFDAGGRENRANPAPFRRQATLFRGYASGAAIQTAESLHRLMTSEAGKAEKIALDFAYPSGSQAEPVQLQRISKGMLFPEAEVEGIQKAMVQRGVLLSVARAVGAGDDTAKALDVFQKGNVSVDRATFLLEMARSLQEQADLFGPKKLDQPNRAKLLFNQAEEALKATPDGKARKDIQGKIDKARKAMKIT